MVVAAGGGGAASGWALHTKLINTNKIEANVFLFCIIISGGKCIKKCVSTKLFKSFFCKKHLLNAQKTDEVLFITGLSAISFFVKKTLKKL